MSDIDKLRDKMDRITFDILKLLKERNDTAKEIGKLKNNLGLGVTNEQRKPTPHQGGSTMQGNRTE